MTHAMDTQKWFTISYGSKEKRRSELRFHGNAGVKHGHQAHICLAVLDSIGRAVCPSLVAIARLVQVPRRQTNLFGIAYFLWL
jgi:hypothetical protein